MCDDYGPDGSRSYGEVAWTSLFQMAIPRRLRVLRFISKPLPAILLHALLAVPLALLGGWTLPAWVFGLREVEQVGRAWLEGRTPPPWYQVLLEAAIPALIGWWLR